jgi:hypothetical protein
MSMSDREREELLGRWIKPSSEDEVEQQERALRMVTAAIGASDLADTSKKIYAKGSYANNTNVRWDSDVDIAVDCHEFLYYDTSSSVSPKVSKTPYTGSWTPKLWRQAVVDAMTKKFGGEVDTSGSTAIHLPMVTGSRPNIDVVPGFHFRRYTSTAATTWHDGSKVFPKSGDSIINWPAQQLKNGRKKNDDTGKRYKNFVRALKNAENTLVEQGEFDEKPSFLMECMLYNVADATLKSSVTLSAGFKVTLQELWDGLNDEATWKTWREPNRLKWAFVGDKAWTLQDARDVVQGTWNLLEYS